MLICSECGAQDDELCFDDCQCRWCLLYESGYDMTPRDEQYQKARFGMRVSGGSVRLLARLAAKVKR